MFNTNNCCLKLIKSPERKCRLKFIFYNSRSYSSDVILKLNGKESDFLSN